MVNPKNNRGQVLVLVALSLIVILGFAALAIDMGYFYHTKNQLQGAADAAALAAVVDLDEDDPTQTISQTISRNTAAYYAGLNSAAGSPVQISNNYNGNNTLNPNNDITVGNWSPTTAPTYSTTRTPVNAVQVRARRTSDSPGSGVTRLFGKTFDNTNQDISAEAIATRPPKPTTSLSLCLNSCSTAGTPTTFYFKENQAPSSAMTIAWTEYSTTQATNFGPNSDIAQYIQGKKHPPNVCCQKVTTNQSAAQQIIAVLQTEFNKQKAATGLNYWDVIVPVFGENLTACPGQSQSPPSACPPGSQPNDPFLVSSYAKVRVTAVTGNPTPTITMNVVECVPCPATGMMGNVPSLVK